MGDPARRSGSGGRLPYRPLEVVTDGRRRIDEEDAVMSGQEHGLEDGVGDPMRFSQQLLADHLVLELREDERGLDDVADRGRADRDALQDAPPLRHQREAAFSLVAQGPQQRVAGFRVNIQFAAGRLFHRDEHARAGPFVAGIGQDRQVFQVGAGPGQDQLAGGGQVTRAPSLAGAPIVCPLLELGEGRGDGLGRSPGNGHHDTAAPGSCGAANRQQEDAPQSAS